MAKKQNSSQEESLDQALVPESEQPYKVPKNWVWTILDSIALYKKGPFGSSITKTMFVPKGMNTFKVYEQGNAIRKDKNYGTYYISEDKFNELKGFKVEPGDLIVSCAGTIGETYQLPDDIEPGIINQALMKVKVSPQIILKYFLFYFDQVLREDITGKSKGTAIKNIPPFSILKNMPFPLPPLTEQQRIVDRIESLFEKLDQAKELIQEENVKTSCGLVEDINLMKRSILARAFRGKLGTNDPKEESAIELLKRIIGNLEEDTTDVKSFKSIKIDPKKESELKTNVEREIYIFLLKVKQAKITDLIFISKNHFEITQALNRMEKVDLIENQNGVYFVKEDSHANN